MEERERERPTVKTMGYVIRMERKKRLGCGTETQLWTKIMCAREREREREIMQVSSKHHDIQHVL